MSILITLSSAFPGEERTELEASGQDARRLAAIIGLPGAVKVSSAIVTFFYDEVDIDAQLERIKGEADDAGQLTTGL